MAKIEQHGRIKYEVNVFIPKDIFETDFDATREALNQCWKELQEELSKDGYHQLSCKKEIIECFSDSCCCAECAEFHQYSDYRWQDAYNGQEGMLISAFSYPKEALEYLSRAD